MPAALPRLSRLSRAISSLWATPEKPRPPASRRMRFEPLEPRLLLSADGVLPGLTSAVTSGLLDFADSFDAHMGDPETGYDQRVPGIVLTNRDTNGDHEVDDADLTAPRFSDLLAIEVDQHATIDTPNSTDVTASSSPDAIYDELYRRAAIGAEKFHFNRVRCRPAGFQRPAAGYLQMLMRRKRIAIPGIIGGVDQQTGFRQGRPDFFGKGVFITNGNTQRLTGSMD